jgi:hypothetical protein
MAQQPGQAKPKHRIQVKITDVATGEERATHEMIVEGIIRGNCCCCTNWVVDPPPPVNGPRPQ